MEIVALKLEQLNPAKYNPRKKLKPGDAEFEKLKRSIETFGFVELIVVNRKTNFTVISGHQRLSVLKHLKWSEVECVIVDLDEESEKALNIAMNKVSGEFDVPLLTDLLKDLDASGFDVSLTGYDAAEMDELFTKAHDKDVSEDGFDLAKALEEASFAKRGDIWTVGRHRLMCGDATKPDDVAALMGGKKANMCLTDPPYGISYEAPTTGLTLMNDNLKGEEFYNFLLASFKNAKDSLIPGGSIYVFHADTEGLSFRKAFTNAKFHLSGVCIWVKNTPTFGRAIYKWGHEPVLFGFRDGAAHKWYSDHSQSTIWNYDKPSSNKVHGTMKPIPLLSYPIKNSCPVNGIVVDTFLGSGSTMLACEQTDRICFGMDLDEKYASVALRRYVEFVGSNEDVFVERDGVKIPYADLVIEVEKKG